METEIEMGLVEVLTLTPGAAGACETVGRVSHLVHEGQMAVKGGAAGSREPGCLAGLKKAEGMVTAADQ